MKKVLKIIGIIVSVIIIIYLISIPVLRAKFPVQENAFFTPTPFVKDSIKKNIPNYNTFYIHKDSLQIVADKFLSNKTDDSIKINDITLKRNFGNFYNSTKSEYYTFEPKQVNKVGIFWMGNGFNIFKLVNNLSELSKRDNIKIYVLNYNQYGFSTGNATFKNQFLLNQNFYNFVNEKQKVNFTAGHSLGTVFATKIAVDNKIPNLILLAPASNLEDLVSYFRGIYTFYAKPYINANELEKSDIAKNGKSSDNIKKYYGNLTLIHGTKDENLPFYMSEKILANCPSKNKELIKINNGDHDSPYLKENWELLIKKLQ